MRALERYFGLEAAGTTLTTEVRAGLVTFLTMSYILFVNPQILSEAGMPANDLVVATALASAAATLAMGLWANYPFALAPGMGLNAYFTYGIVQGLGVAWQVALAAVFVEGILFLVLSVTGVRAALMHAIPTSIKIATMCGIGLLLAIIGFNSAGLIVDHPATLITLGDVRSPRVVLALLGLLVMSVLASARVRGAILIGIFGVTVACWSLGISAPPESLVTLLSLPEETVLALDFGGLMTGKLIVVILALLFVDIFNTAGALIGVGRLGGFVDEEGDLPRGRCRLWCGRHRDHRRRRSRHQYGHELRGVGDGGRRRGQNGLDCSGRRRDVPAVAVPDATRRGRACHRHGTGSHPGRSDDDARRPRASMDRVRRGDAGLSDPDHDPLHSFNC